LGSAERSWNREDTCFGRRERRVEEQCFGLPYGAAIVGIAFGLFIIIIGLAISLELDIGRIIGPSAAIIIGSLIVAGAIYGLTRKRKD
jgi:cytochrome c biogenesis protein CcdA